MILTEKEYNALRTNLFDDRPSLGSSTLRYAGKSQKISNRNNLLWDKSTVLTASLQELDKSLKEVKDFCFVDNIQAQRLKAAELDDTGEMLTGQIDFTVILNLPKYQRRTSVTVAVPIRAGQALRPRLFQDSAGRKFAITERGLRDHLHISRVDIKRNFVNSTGLAALIER